MSEFVFNSMVLQPSESASNHESSVPARPRREVRSTRQAREQLSNLISSASDNSRTRNRRPAQGKKAHVIPRPSKKSGLNPSGVPYSSQLNRPSEFIQTPDAPSNPSFDLIPNHMPSTNISSVYNSTTAQVDNSFEELSQTAHYHNGPPSSSLDDLPFDNDLPSLFPSSSSNTDWEGWNFSGEPGVDSLSPANIPDTVPEQPLRPGEVTRGGLTPPVPVSTWRMTPTVADQIAPPASREGAIIRSLGRTTDVLANRHAKRTPYRLPPTPPPSVMQSEFEASMVSVPGPGSLTEGISVPMRTASVARPNARPAKSRSRPSEAVNQVIMCAKDRFRMMLLTTNAMWPDVTAFFRAQEQLVSACKSYGMDDIEAQSWIERSVIKKVLHDGSNLRNEFKNAARQLVTGNYYNIFPQSHIPNPEDANHYIARKDVPQLFEHPAVEEAIVRVIFATPRSIGSRHIMRFQDVPVPTIALACCALYCALREWEGGTFDAINFEVASHRTLYLSIAQNLQSMLRNASMSIDLQILWGRIHHRGCHVTTSKKGHDAGAVGLFVDDMINASASGVDTGLEPELSMDNYQ